MNKKTLTIIFASIFLIGIITANTISNLEGIEIPSPIIAGDTFEANFSFDYIAFPDNDENPPLIIKLDIESDDTFYPVWKGDFEMNGRIEKSFFGIHWKTIYFNCSEEEPQTIEHTIGSTTINEVANGTFYCYNEEGDLNLNEHDDVFLMITSRQALWPGGYDLTAELFYMNDTTNPMVVIQNDWAFDNYYRELSDVEVIVNITDGSGIDEKWGVIFAESNITVPFSHINNGLYYFTKILPIDIEEGEFPLVIFAEDNEGNQGSDSVTLKTDLTGPTLELLQPNESGVYNDTIPIELKVTDEKSGVDNSSVEYRIREIINGTICPSTGLIFGNFSCYNSGWIGIGLNVTTYQDNFDATELNSGEYLFEARAQDVLGNEGELV